MMDTSTVLNEMQQAVQEAEVDAWVLYDFRGTNGLAWTMLGLAPNAHCTRRWVVVIPAYSAPFKIVHQMEQIPLSHLDIEARIYATAAQYESVMKNALSEFKTIAMEYSPMNQIPVTSKVDAGTIEFIRSLGATIVTSANMAQNFSAVLTEKQIYENQKTASDLRAIVLGAFQFVRDSILFQNVVTEYDVQQKIVRDIANAGMVTESAPIVAIGPNAASPHYAPSANEHSVIEKNMVLLIDAWAKNASTQDAVFADITWMGYTADTVPEEIERDFQTMAAGRNAGLQLVMDRFANHQPVYGFEVDDACRAVIDRAGRGELFIHRTGHNITTELHGPGANIDNYETKDTRVLLPGMSFSIEPGLYDTNGIGMRTEIDVVIHHDGTVHVPTMPIQEAVLPLLADHWNS